MEEQERAKLNKLAEMIKASEYIVFFGGAGVSTESGLKDFRSVDGLYHEQYDYPPETILSHSFFVRHPEEFFRFYRSKMLAKGVKPNGAHICLAELEKMGKVKAVITQNIDGLHQEAGSKKVLELHGSTLRNRCVRCGKFFGAEEVPWEESVPRCECRGVIKPEVVLYGEGLDEQVIAESIAHIRKADMLIVGGTSLTVYPAAGFLDYFQGRYLVLMNRDETPKDGGADLIIRTPIGESLAEMMKLL